jgi:hypothetical protein
MYLFFPLVFDLGHWCLWTFPISALTLLFLDREEFSFTDEINLCLLLIFFGLNMILAIYILSFMVKTVEMWCSMGSAIFGVIFALESILKYESTMIGNLLVFIIPWSTFQYAFNCILNGSESSVLSLVLCYICLLAQLFLLSYILLAMDARYEISTNRSEEINALIDVSSSTYCDQGGGQSCEDVGVAAEKVYLRQQPASNMISFDNILLKGGKSSVDISLGLRYGEIMGIIGNIEGIYASQLSSEVLCVLTLILLVKEENR